MRNYIIDTCVLLHDPECLHKFEENNLYIPLSVIDDLDEIKNRKDNVGWAAREIFRKLDKYDLKEITTNGVEITKEGGKLFIYTPNCYLHDGKPNIDKVNSDDALINTCLELKEKYKNISNIIVTKDVGLRIRATAYGCEAENYKSDLIEDVYTGIINVKLEEENDWKLINNNEIVDFQELSENCKNKIQKYIFINTFILWHYNDIIMPTIYENGYIKIIKKTKTSYLGIKYKNYEQACALYALTNPNIHFVVIAGPAGTGKTLLALAAGFYQVDNGVYDRVITIKPIIPVGGKDLGALPGDKNEKLSNWLSPIKDNIQQLVFDKKTGLKGSYEELLNDKKLEVEAMTYIQGRSIPNSYIIVDEFENITPREARMVVERCGKGSKIVAIGDLTQIEHPFLDNKSSGLAHALNGIKGQPTCAGITLSKVERSELSAIASIIFKNS